MKGFQQISLFDITDENEEELKEYQPLGNIYGKGVKIYPHIPSKEGNKYLTCLNPLEDYDYILVAFSAGKDSVASVLYLLDLGVPKEKIILLHHKIDGDGPNDTLEMDWVVTNDYCRKFADAMGLKIKFSWREGGFATETLRNGASAPVYFEELESDVLVKTNGANWDKSEILRKQIKDLNEIGEDTTELKESLKSLGYRKKFPAKTASLATRWCSSALKIEVCDRILRYSQSTFKDCKVIIVDGVRREESSNRSRYNELEKHSTNAHTKRRFVHAWRPIIEWTESQVWDITKRYLVRPMPSYYAGFNRCSCAFCIFSMPEHFAGARQLMPERFEKLVELENDLGFTLDNKKDLISYIGQAKSCVPSNIDGKMVEIIRTGIIPEDYIIVNGEDEWELPVGAFKGAKGGAC